jgi:predicted nucleic acid-binding protein
MSVFVDTGVLFAAAHRRDSRHRRAVAILKKIAGDAPVATDHVIGETWALVRARAGWESAMRFWRGIRETPLRVEAATASDLERAESIADAWADQELDLVDCVSFAVMERLGCRRAATFDADFAVYRFGRDRSKAFEVVA